MGISESKFETPLNLLVLISNSVALLFSLIISIFCFISGKQIHDIFDNNVMYFVGFALIGQVLMCVNHLVFMESGQQIMMQLTKSVGFYLSTAMILVHTSQLTIQAIGSPFLPLPFIKCFKPSKVDSYWGRFILTSSLVFIALGTAELVLREVGHESSNSCKIPMANLISYKPRRKDMKDYFMFDFPYIFNISIIMVELIYYDIFHFKSKSKIIINVYEE